MSGPAAHRLTPMFLPGSEGRLFCLEVSPRRDSHLSLIHLPAFAEEMNKSRLMVARQARRLADVGVTTLIVDHFGTGDSEGDFENASWSTWLRDTELCFEWLQQQGRGEVGLWGHRLGAALALDFAARGAAVPACLVLWQPVFNTQLFLKQFQRLQAASELFASSSDVSETQDDGSTEIAGYSLSERLIGELTSFRPDYAIPASVDVALFEISQLAEPTLSRPVQLAVDALQENGNPVRCDVLSGDPFWSTAEIATSDRLLDLTTACLQSNRRPL